MKILNLVVAGMFLITASSGFAATNTGSDSKWLCSTNASSASTDADKAADDKMANTESAGPLADVFAFASANCRDCTKITCEVQDK